METVSVETCGSESKHCEKNLELSDKKKKKRSGKKRKVENELKNNVDVSSNEDKVQLSDKRSISSKEPGATLHHKEPVLPSVEDSVPDANTNGDSRKRSRSRKKKKTKKEDASSEENLLDDSEKTTNEDQVPRTAQLCIGPDLSTGEDLKVDATNMTRSQRRKIKKERARNALKESVVGTHSINAETDSVLKVNETVIPKTKRKKKKKNKTIEVCDPLGNTLATSTQSEAIECISGEENVSQSHGTTKEKETNEIIEVKEDVLGADECDVKNKKRKGKKKKMSSADLKAADIEVCDPSVNTLLATVESADIVVEDTTSKTEEITVRKKSKVRNPEKRKARTEDENVESNEDTLGAEVESVIVGKRQKKKRKKNKNYESVDNLASKIEVSATEEKSVNSLDNTKTKKKVKRGEADHDGEGADCDNKVEVITKKKKKKKKTSLDHKTDNLEASDDVSLSKNDAELESNQEKLVTSLSSSVLVHNNPVQGVASPETIDVPRCSCDGQRSKKLLVFDLNGILADIVQGYSGQIVPDGKVSYRSVFLRPFVHSFLDFCFERFDIGIWSSRHIGLDYMTNLVMRHHVSNVLFCFGQNICITTRFKTPENSRKPIFLKNLARVWERFGTCLACGKLKYDETNTLLIDDSPDKSLCNPPHTSIFPHTYQYTDREDTALGPEGELRKYLERLAEAESVQQFVAENPFGQTAITETHESWEFYSKVVAAYSNSSTKVLTM